MIGFSQSNDDPECQWICVMFFSHDDHDKEWLVSANPMMIMNVSEFVWCFFSHDDHDKEWLVSANPMMIMNVSEFVWCVF